jgi:hypothetical protein
MQTANRFQSGCLPEKHKTVKILMINLSGSKKIFVY